MKLAIPKLRSEMLPATTPAMTATRPSNAFHAMVKYSSLRPWRTIAVRSRRAVSLMPAVYNLLRGDFAAGIVRSEFVAKAKRWVPPLRLFVIAAFCRLAKSLSHSQQMGWLVGAVVSETPFEALVVFDI